MRGDDEQALSASRNATADLAPTFIVTPNVADEPPLRQPERTEPLSGVGSIGWLDSVVIRRIF